MAGKKNSDKEGSSWVGGIEKYSRKIWLAGLVAGQPSLGFLGGLAIGVAAAVAIWWVDRRR